MVRLPAVAGRFYPDNPGELTAAIEGFLDPVSRRRRATGLIVPHAGYTYSGHVAGAVYSRIVVPARIVILSPNHTGLGKPISIMRKGSWKRRSARWRSTGSCAMR